MWDNTLILGDLHFGERDASELIMNHQKKVLDYVIQYCLDNNINKIIQTGDFWDVRRSTNTKVLNFWKTNFLDVLLKHNIVLHTIVSNHDIYYKNTLKPNTLIENVGHYKNVIIYDKPTEVDSILFIPWICEENRECVMESINKTECRVLVGHLEVNGVIMVGTTKCDNGLPQSTFNKFDLTISGHFHNKGTYGNIEYVGTPYQCIWSDYGLDKGFHILNSSELEFHRLDYDLFYRFTYDEAKDMSYVLDADLKDKHVKLIIENRNDFKLYETFMNKLQNKGMYDLKIIEPLMDLNSGDSVVQFDGELIVKNTTELIQDYVTDLYPEKSDKLTKMMLGLHTEARSL